jgi:PAS domain S-box-containing protein
MNKKPSTRSSLSRRPSLEEIPEPAAILDAAGEVVQANKALSTLLGVKSADLGGASLRERVDARYRRSFDAVWKSKRPAGSKRKVLFEGSRGRPVPVLLAGRRLPAREGGGVLLVATDLRELEEEYAEHREAETAALVERQRLYEVMERLPAYVVLLSPDYHVPFANKFFRDRFGDSRGRRCFEYLFDRTEPCETCESYKVLRTGKRHHWEWTGPDGRDYDIYDFPFRDWDGSPLIMEMGIDVTEQKRAEEELRRHRDRLQDLVEERTKELEGATSRLQTTVDSLAEGLIVSDLEGNLFHWNPAAVAMHGFGSEAECRRMFPEFAEIFELSTEKDGVLPLDEWPLARILRGETLRNFEATIRRPGADWTRVFSYGGTLARGEDGTPLVAVITLSDVTERTRAEETVRRSEERFRVLAENTPVNISVVSIPDGRILYTNRGFEALYGYEAGELLGKTTLDLYADAAQRPVVLDELRRQGALHDREIRSRRKDGSEMWISIFVSRTVFQGEDAYIISSLDLTERKAAERQVTRLALFPELNPNPVIELDPDGRAVFMNPAARETLRNLGAEERPDLFLPGDFGEIVEDLKAERTKSCLREVKAGGAWYLASIVATPGFGTLRLYAIDITERKQAEEDLKRSNERLGQFAYVASHDLQEPLRIVASYSQLLEKRYRDKLDKDANDFIDFIVDAASRMQRLITDLLAYSRAGDAGAERTRVDSGEAVRKVLATLSATIQACGATIACDDLPVVTVSEVGFTQLLQNLLSNALKFRGESPPVIRVAARRDGNEWIFSVSDNGIGIAPEYREKVFQIFQRLHSKDRYPGTGIGLSICKKIVESWGGRIWVESEPRAGSTFHFTIPAERG